MGQIPRFRIFIRWLTVCSRIPERPLARSLIRRAVTARTVSLSRAFPTPAAWLMSIFSWSCQVSSLEIITSLRAPKPVVTPYIIFSSWTQCSISFRVLKIRFSDSSVRRTFASYRAMTTRSSMVIPSTPRKISSISGLSLNFRVTD